MYSQYSVLNMNISPITEFKYGAWQGQKNIEIIIKNYKITYSLFYIMCIIIIWK